MYQRWHKPYIEHGATKRATYQKRMQCKNFKHNTSKDAKPWEKPESLPFVHGLKANAEEVGGHDDVWSIDMRKLINILHLKAERKSLSVSMGNAGVANPSVLKLLLTRFSNSKNEYLNL